MRKQGLLLLFILPRTSGFSASSSPKPKPPPSVKRKQNKRNNSYNNKKTSYNQGLSDRLLSLSRAGRTDEAIALYYDAWDTANDTPRPSTRTMNNAIGACARPYRPRYEDAFEIYHHGVDAKGLTPNVYTFGSLMSACAKIGDVKKCTALLNEMKGYGVKPNSVIYSTAISACERCTPTPKSDLALNLLKRGVNEGHIDGFMNIVGYNAAISVFARAGEWKLACQLLNEMEGNEENVDSNSRILDTDTFIPRPDEVTYGTVMAACERAKEWKMVLDISKQMEEKRKDLTMDGIGLSSTLHACQQLALGEESLAYLEKMKHLGNPNNNGGSGRNNNNGYGNKKRREALRGPDAVAYRLALSACARGGMIPEAIELLKEMEQVTGSVPDVVAYSAVIGGCAEAGEYIKAFELLKEMRRRGVEPNVITYSTVISACANASANAPCVKDDSCDELNMTALKAPMRAALSLLRKMEEIGGDVEPNIVTYNAAIRACAEGLDISRAFKLLKILTERGLEPTIITYGTLMTACERVGNVEGVTKVFKTMKEQGIRPNEIIYGAAISCCRKASQPERTLLLLRKMLENKLQPNTAVYNTAIIAQVEAKNMDKASAVYNLLKSPHAIKARPNRQTYNILIKAMADNSEPAIAEYYLSRMREDGMEPDVDLFTGTVSSYERCGEPIKALNLMEKMREEGYDFYDMKLFDVAFKQGVKVINTVVGGKKAKDSGSSSRKGSPEIDDDLVTQGA